MGIELWWNWLIWGPFNIIFNYFLPDMVWWKLNMAILCQSGLLTFGQGYPIFRAEFYEFSTHLWITSIKTSQSHQMMRTKSHRWTFTSPFYQSWCLCKIIQQKLESSLIPLPQNILVRICQWVNLGMLLKWRKFTYEILFS